MLRAAPRIAVVALCYAMLAGWLTWPLAAHLGTHLPRNYPNWDFDQYYSGWVLAWETRALVERGVAFAAANIYHPEPEALFYGPLALGALPYFAPVFLASGNPTLALNFVFLAGVALSAAALHLVVRAWTGSHAAAAVAAVAFLANRWLLLTLVPCVPHMAVLLYFPLIIFAAAAAQPSRRWIAALALLVVLQCFTDPVYVAPAVLAPLAALAAWRAARAPTRRAGARLAAIVAVAALLVGATFYPYLAVRAANPDLETQTNWRRPAAEWVQVPGGLFGPMSPLAIPSLALVLIGAAGAAAALRGWRGSRGEARAWRHALLWSGAGLALSLPLAVRIGETIYTLPHVALARAWLPFFASIRVPERLRVAALIGITLLAGLAFAELLRHAGLAPGTARARRLVRGAAAALVALAMIAQFEYAIGQPAAFGPRLPGGYKIEPAITGDSPVLTALRAAGGPTLELPLPARQPMLAGAHAAAMYRSIFHRQPLVNGYSSYWPRRFPERMRIAAQLPDAAALQALRGQTGVELILVRARGESQADRLGAAQRERWLELARHGGRDDLELLAADDSLLLFRVADPPQ